MKIAFVVYRFPALSETFILSQITGLIDRGHEVDIYSSKQGDLDKLHASVGKYNLLEKTYYLPGPPYNPRSRKLTIKNHASLILSIFLLSIKKPLFLLRLLLLKPYGFNNLVLRLLYAHLPSIVHGQYDIIHCHFAYMGAAGLTIQQVGSPNCKVVATFHGHDVNISDQEKAKKQYQWLFSRGDLFTANTNFTAKQAAMLGCPLEKIAILPVGLEISKYQFRENKFPHGGDINILTVARLVEKKGIEYSIRAVAKAIKCYPKLKYNIVGDGHLMEPLKNLAGALGIANSVTFLGWKTQEEILSWYKESHIFILASVTAANGDKEGQGLVLQEAQAVGLPVLSTIHNGIPDGLKDGLSGFLVAERDVDALAEKILYLAQNPNLWSSMSKAGREHVEKNYNIDNLNNRLQNLYLEAKPVKPPLTVEFSEKLSRL